MGVLGAIWPHNLHPSFLPTMKTMLARFAGKAGSNPPAPVHITAALLASPTHATAPYSDSDVISLDGHDMNFPQEAINYRKDFLVYEQGVDGSPSSGKKRMRVSDHRFNLQSVNSWR